MAYAGNIIIQTKLDNKEFNKNLESLNKKLAKIDFKKLTDMRKEVNLCQNALQKMYEHTKNFNSIRLNSQKFDHLAEKTHEASRHIATIDRHLGTLADRLNALNISIISQLLTDLKALSKLDFDKVQKGFEKVNNLKKEMNNIDNQSSTALMVITNSLERSLVPLTNMARSIALFNEGLNRSRIPIGNIAAGSVIIDAEWREVIDTGEKVKRTFRDIFNNSQKLKDAFRSIGAFAVQASHKIMDVFKNLGSKVITTVSNFSKKTINTMQKWSSNIKRTMKRTSDSFKSFMYALGVDVSFAGIVRTIKNTVQEMQDMQSTILGFNTMIDVQGLSLDRANDFVKKYASDGLVSLQGAMTQYKNFTLRGFKAEEIERLMTIAKDFAIVNKKAGVDLETALINLSEGIKLDLSRLMDASGLSENLSNIYSDYANEIGKGVSSLTDEERNKAILKYFEGMNKYSEGNAAKIAKTFIGTVSRLKTQTKYMFAELGNTIAFVAKPFLEDLIKAFAKLEQIFKSVNDFIRNSVFSVNGKMKELADEYNAIQNSVENITDLTEEQKIQADALATQYESIRVALKGIEKSLKSVVDSIFVITRNTEGEITKLFGVSKDEVKEYKKLEKESKAQLDNLVNLSEEKSDFKQVVDDSTKSLEAEANAAEKVLAPFDTINQMKFNTGGEEDEPQELISEDTSETAKEETTETIFWLDFLKTSISKFLKSVDFTPLKESWERLKLAIFGVDGTDFSKGVNTFYDILKNLVSFILEKAVPTILNITSTIIEAFKNASINFEPLKKSFKDLFDTIFGDNGENLESTVGFFFNEILIPALKWFVEWAAPKIIDLLNRFAVWVKDYGPYIVKAVEDLWAILEPVLDWVYQKLIEIFDWFSKQDEETKEKIAKLIITIGAIGIALTLLGPIITLIGGAFASLVKLITKHSIGELIIIGIKKLGGWVINTAIPWITGTAAPAVWGAIKTALTTVGKGIFTAVKTFLSSTIGKVIVAFIAGFKLGQYIAEHWFSEEELKALYWNVMLVIDVIKDFFYNLVMDVVDWFKSIPDKVKQVFNNIKDWFRNFNLFEFLGQQIDKVKDKLSNFWDELTGKKTEISYGVNPLDGYYGNVSPYTRAATAPTYTVPAYANGVVLPANTPRLAIVGDQKQGTSIETQISTMMEAMQRVLSQNQNGQVIQNVLKVDGQVLYKSNNKVSRQRGAKMISR